MVRMIDHLNCSTLEYILSTFHSLVELTHEVVKSINLMIDLLRVVVMQISDCQSELEKMLLRDY